MNIAKCHFSSSETIRKDGTYESFVTTFYFNECNFCTNQAFGGYRKILYFRNAIQQHEG